MNKNNKSKKPLTKGKKLKDVRPLEVREPKGFQAE
jgi:hypothetical protein